MADPIVICEGVTKRFPKAEMAALERVSGHIARGGISGLVGPDGAGKTTLLRILGGLLVPSEGTVRVTGQDPAQEASGLRSRVGYMPQRFGLYEDLSVGENLSLYADLRGLVGARRKETFDRLLAFTDLTKFTARAAGKLSGGMKQKLGLACTLLGQPELLLLDEPSVGVDPISRRELWKMVRALTETGMTVVWSTSYLDEAELCDEVFLLNEGRLLFAGVPADLTAQVAGRCFQLRGLAGRSRQILVQARKRPEVLDGVVQGRSLRLVLRRGAGLFPPQEIGGGEAAQFVPAEPRFEDGFIDILGGAHETDSVLAKHVASVATDRSVVEAVDLTKKFGEFVATDAVNFSVAAGEIFGLLGPNGAGKSTTFKMLCGLLTPTSGAARVMDLDLRTSAVAARQRLGYMAQKFSLYTNLTVGQNLAFFSGIYGITGTQQRAVTERMTRVFDLQPHLNEKAASLPLGFKQRLALACAVMHEPEILFLDEPTSGVDPVTRREFWTHINALAEKGVTAIVTTHFMDEAEYCDRVGIIFRGRMIAAGTPDELKALAATPGRPDPTMEDAFIELVSRN